MNLRGSSEDGIVLATRKFREGDNIVSIFSKKNGRISVIAKGVRKVKSRKSGHLEPFNHVKYLLVNGHGLPIVTEAEIVESGSEIKKKFEKSFPGLLPM